VLYFTKYRAATGGGAILRITAGIYGGRLIKTPEGLSTRPTAQFVREALFSILAQDIRGAVFVDLFAGSGAVGIEALSRGAAMAIFADMSRNCCKIINDNLKALDIGKAAATVMCADLSRRDAYNSVREAIAQRGGAGVAKDALARQSMVGADIVYADPPYGFAAIEKLPLCIAGSGLCNAGGLIIIEHGKKSIMPDTMDIPIPDKSVASDATESTHTPDAPTSHAPDASASYAPSGQSAQGPSATAFVKTRVRSYGDTRLSFYRVK